ncbi:hypothetical protein HQ489_02200 [Candidatus Woesearchaeota archaeon]|nr:hypothetical protein [Candidatus Woesearchaeota archaeon]
MLIIGGSIINTITTSGSIGDCNAQDYNGDGVVNATDQTEPAYVSCDSTKNNGYTILNIISIMMVIGGVVMSVRGFAAG